MKIGQKMGAAILAGLTVVSLVATGNVYAKPQEVKELQEVQTEQVEQTALYNVPLDDDLQKHIIETCKRYHIDSSIVFAVICKESGYDAGTVGDGGNSLGLMQIQGKWHRERMERLGCDDLMNPFQNVTVGIDILANLLYRYEGEPERALMAYNAGVAGANTYWFSKGVYSTEYSRAVMAKAEELRGDMK